MYSLRERLRRGRMVLDGAMGTMLPAGGEAPADGNLDMLVLTCPHLIADIHRQYLEAGADLITTCTFNAQRISQAKYNAEHLVAEINRQAARLARSEADRYTTANPEKPRFVAGSIGPTECLLSASNQISYQDLEAAYIEQMRALIRGGVDALLIETAIDILNAKAAISAAMKAMQFEGRKIELMLSFSITDADGCILSGQTIEELSEAVRDVPLLSIGLNCSIGIDAMHAPLRRLKECNPGRYISVHPNAGLPDSSGKYNDTPQYMAEAIRRFIEEGLVDIVGGCCGTTPTYIQAMQNPVNTEFIMRKNPDIQDFSCSHQSH